MNFICFNLFQRINPTLAKFQSSSKNFADFNRRYVSIGLIALLLFGLGATRSLAGQGLIDVDIVDSYNPYTFSGAAVLGNAGDVWNELTGPGQNLFDSTGNATVVGLNITGWTSMYADTGGGAPASDPATAGLLTDYLDVNGGTINFQITGLLANSPYNLIAYSAGDQTGQSATFGGAITTEMGPVSRGAFILGANYGQNANAISDANGTLTFSISASGYVAFNGLQIAGDFPANITLTGYTAIPVGDQRPVTLTIPAAANQSQAFTFQITNSNPSILGLSGAVNNVLTLVFPQGSTNSQVVMVQGLALGTAALLGNSPLASLTITTVPTSGLIGHWLAGQQDLTDTSGYSPAGTHDGIAAAASFSSDPGFNSDVPPGFTGFSADLGLNGCMIQIQNTSQANDGTNYVSTFDNLVSQQMTVAFWAKLDANTTVGAWQPYISKRGEEAAWQIRTAAALPITSFTVRGTSGDPEDNGDEFDSATIITNNAWHHFVCSRDGVTGRRKLFIDGQLSGFIPNDFGSYSLDADAYLILGGKWSQQSGVGGSAGSQLYAELYDVRIYAEALNGSQVQNLYIPNTANVVAFAETPVIDTGHQGAISIAIPDGANASQAVSVTVTNNSGLLTIAGYTGTVFTVTFPAGAPNTLTLALTAGATEGSAQLSFGSSSLNSASVNVFVSGPHLIGEWGTNDSLSDLSGYTNYNTVAGTHNGFSAGSGTLNFNSDVPSSKSGQSLDFTAGNVMVLITNTSVADSNYRPTFDNIISHQFSVACWVKETTPQIWTAFAAKRGDDGVGFQVRRYGSTDGASFTLRDSSSEIGDMGGNDTVVNDGNWHHVAAVWDGYAGVRKLYVDGVLDTNTVNDFAPFCLANGYHLTLGAQESQGVGEGIAPDNIFTGLLYDVRVYDYPLTALQVAGIYGGNSAPILSVTKGINNTVVLSWPSAGTVSYLLQTNSAVNGGSWGNSGLTPVLQNGQYIVTDTATNVTRFYRLAH